MRRVGLVVVLLSFATPALAQTSRTATVERVVDGDTIEVRPTVPGTESEATVGEAKQVLLLVVGEGGIGPALLSALRLEVVEEPSVHPPLFRLGAFRPDGIPVAFHARIVRAGGQVATGIHRGDCILRKVPARSSDKN